MSIKSAYLLTLLMASLALLCACGHTAAEAGAVPSDNARTTHSETQGKATPMYRYSTSGHDITPLSRAAVEKLAKSLTPEQYRITQKAGTERPFCGTLLDNKKQGTYCCVVCGLPLFSSDHKFKSGTGWPSFFQPIDTDHVSEKPDHSHGMLRTEITCARCDAHLGHVFNDGPDPTGMRHCLNSEALVFYESGEEMPERSRPVDTQVAYFAGGCFWGIEHYFEKGPGVLDAISGYMQGHIDNPTYQQVSSGNTGHAEAVKVVYDPNRITYRRLLEAFFAMHDPTQLNRQGPDIGSQYRSGVYCATEEQCEVAKQFIAELAGDKRFGSKKIVTEVERAKTFWQAEDYHQDYIANTGRACHVTNPW